MIHRSLAGPTVVISLGLLLFAEGVNAQAPYTQIAQYPGVTVIFQERPPLDVRAVRPKNCDTDLCLPTSVVITNTSDRVALRAWLLIKFPELEREGVRYGLAVLLNNQANRDEMLAPNESVELPLKRQQISDLESYLRAKGYTLGSLTKAEILITQVDFDDGTYFTPAGFYPAADR